MAISLKELDVSQSQRALCPAVWQKPWHWARQGRGGAAEDLHSQHGVGAAGAGHQVGGPPAQHAHRLRPEEGQAEGCGH